VAVLAGAPAAWSQAVAPDKPAVSPSLIARVNQQVDADSARLTTLFKDLHQHPEIGFTEVRTAGIVAKELRALGFTVTEGIAKTGVVGVLRNGPGPVVWFRADMDAIGGVRETTGLAWAAKARQRLPGGVEIDVMHSCGHDAHVTWMLGMARAMAALKADWSGTLVVYGQPAEEPGWARRRWCGTGCGSAASRDRTTRSACTPSRARSAPWRARRACAWQVRTSSTSPSSAWAATAPRRTSRSIRW
jgi:hippurate hydrolase